MDLTSSLALAAQTLGLTRIDDPGALKAAYRRLLLQHPPDRDPEGFRRIRSAYELLKDPGMALQQSLLRPLPASDPPRIAAAEPATPGITALAVLRLMAARVEPRELLQPSPAQAEEAP